MQKSKEKLKFFIKEIWTKFSVIISYTTQICKEYLYLLVKRVYFLELIFLKF